MNLKSLWAMVREPHLMAQGQLQRDSQAFVRIHFLCAAFESGLLSALESPATLAELISKLRIQRPELLTELLHVGMVLGELAHENGRYKIRGSRARALAAKDGDAIAAFVQEWVSYHAAVYQHLPEYLRGGELGNYLQGTGNLIARSSRMLEPFVAVFVQDVIRETQPARMLEIGCGSGVYLRYAAQANPALTGIAIDMQADVVEQTRRNLQAWDLADRFELKTANVLTTDLSGPFDLVTLYNNIYYFPVTERVPLFQQIGAWLKPGGALALVSMLRGDTINSANIDLVMQSTQGGAPMPVLNELVAQLRESGFAVTKQMSLIPGELFYGVLARKA